MLDEHAAGYGAAGAIVTVPLGVERSAAGKVGVGCARCRALWADGVIAGAVLG
jgi:hypothetical protein